MDADLQDVSSNSELAVTWCRCSNARDGSGEPIAYPPSRTLCGNPYACNLSTARTKPMNPHAHY